MFAAGSLTAIVGANGAGKTTLLHAIAGLVAPRHGSIEIAGAEVPADLAYLPQSDSVDRDFPISVLEFVALGGWARIGALGRVPPELRSRGMSALQAVGLEELAGDLLGQLSVVSSGEPCLPASSCRTQRSFFSTSRLLASMRPRATTC